MNLPPVYTGTSVPSNDRWRRAVIGSDSTILDAIKNLDQVAIQIALVVNDAGALQGTVSDGDIRRGLLKGLGLSTSVIEILNSAPLLVPPGLDRQIVLQLMIKNKVRQIPVVDDGNLIVGLHLWDELMAPRFRDNTMVIMAGGFGMRLRPATETCPKPMLPVAGKPMMEHIIARAKTEGFRNFIVSLHYLGDIIENYFGDGSHFDVSIKYIREEVPLGTVGSLSLIEPKLALPVVVTNGDVMTSIQYSQLLDFHNFEDSVATMAVREYEWEHPFGTVEVSGMEITHFQEKPVIRSLINAGVYVFSPNVLDLIPKGTYLDIPAFVDEIRKENMRVIAYPVHEQWRDIGRHEDLEEIDHQIRHLKIRSKSLPVRAE